jgi:hypothetical protein
MQSTADCAQLQTDTDLDFLLRVLYVMIRASGHLSAEGRLGKDVSDDCSPGMISSIRAGDCALRKIEELEELFLNAH